MSASQLENNNKADINQFNLKEVEKNTNDAIKEIIGVHAGIKIAVKENDKYDVITFESKDVYKGVVPRLFESLHLISWGSSINDNDELLIQVNYRYTHIGGGSNGFSVANLHFDVAGNLIDGDDLLDTSTETLLVSI
jgi:hypothetical protein